MNKKLSTALAMLLLVIASCNNSTETAEVSEPGKMDWWREARFGLFIHWGLYAVPAGEWNGQTNHAEWIRETARIPLEKYNEFLPQFNPVKFDADAWVSMAKAAGMKYIVITSKHHDGFCLFDSKETDFDVMSTPFKRDILKELSAACEKQGMTLCFYHSIMDWHHPDYLPRRGWEKGRSSEGADYDRYVTYMKSQLKELVNNYGKIGVLWFDGEWENTWTHDRGEDLYNYLSGMKPDLIINNRVDKGRQGMQGMTADSTFVGDFGTPEQEVPSTGFPGIDWESCITMNDHWGYNKNDNNWKSPEELVRMLIDIASKGGNLLLNIGPTAEGLFPDQSIERLKALGEWMKVNGESIYGTSASPFSKTEWGRCTQKKNEGNTTLYLHVFDWPEDGKLVLPGVTGKVNKAYGLADPGKKKLKTAKEGTDVIVDISNASKSDFATVIALEIKGKL